MVKKNNLQIDIIKTINNGIDRLEKLIKDKEKKENMITYESVLITDEISGVRHLLKKLNNTIDTNKTKKNI